MPSIDAAILDVLKGPNAWSLPAIRQEFRFEEDTPEKVEATLMARVAPVEEELSDWLERAEPIKEALEAHFHQPRSEGADLESWQRLADLISQQITTEAKDRIGQERDLRKLIVLAGRISPRYRPVMRRVADRMRGLLDRRHNTLVDLYYLLLAVQAHYDPEAQGGPEFDDPRSLVAFLRNRAAG